MNIAKASEKDIEMALALSGQLEALEKCFMPLAHDDDGDEDDSMFDREDPDQCKIALNRIIDTLRRGSIGRVVWGMAALCDQKSIVLNPDSDIIELHPDLSNRKQRQTGILQWANATFGRETASVTAERIARFMEEAIELAQAVDMTSSDIKELVDYVYSRNTGVVSQEIGQVGVALLALAEHLNINADQEERAEFQRISELPKKHWQRRQNAKAEHGVALKTTE
ncbi:hypothetical protein [Methylomonas koyamae]|uniref:hypothetical protein n=1 Tax=Methylomonas koyamae TaxID=702114 RepID=UPI00112664D6|nr:hypothetical protein [Methylomonas koyamae]TPQ24907.1 hypothetical protein C2U68_17165 [Methylomonas koyamae]